MMNESAVEITLAGGPETLLSHMSMLGMALILEEELGRGRVRCRWTDETDPAALVHVGGVDSASDIGRIVRDHARRHQDGAEWMRAQHDAVGSLFSARTKMPAGAQLWREVLDQRRRAGTAVRGLDSEMVLGIGERAWWLSEHRQYRPDHGASAWEMKTRNRGMEFLKDGLVPMAAALAAREPDEVLDGLTGTRVADEVGKNKPESRTATGLGPVGPTDVARAWAGLWAIAAVPVMPLVGERSVSPAAVPPSRGERGLLLMPMSTGWVTPSRWRRAMRSAVTVAAAGRHGDDVEVAAARDQLAAWGFRELMVYEVSVTGSTSAPERRALSGRRVG